MKNSQKEFQMISLELFLLCDMLPPLKFYRMDLSHWKD